jgi:hypothetical protein
MLLKQPIERNNQSTIPVHKLPEEVTHAKELAYLRDIGWAGPLRDGSNLVSIRFLAMLPHNKAKILQFRLEEGTLLAFTKKLLFP